jgi:hypothetical protein
MDTIPEFKMSSAAPSSEHYFIIKQKEAAAAIFNHSASDQQDPVFISRQTCIIEACKYLRNSDNRAKYDLPDKEALVACLMDLNREEPVVNNQPSSNQ